MHYNQIVVLLVIHYYYYFVLVHSIIDRIKELQTFFL